MVFGLFSFPKLKQDAQQNQLVLFVCMVLASIFWLVLKLSNTYVTSRNVEVAYILPADKAFSELPPEEFEIKVRGTGWNLLYDYLESDVAKITIDLNLVNGPIVNREQLITRINDQVYKPLEVLSIQSRQQESLGQNFISLLYEDRFQKKVPILFSGKIDFAQGYDFKDSLRLTPDSVVIDGPKSIVEQITSWKTIERNINDLKEDFREEIALKTPERKQIAITPIEITLEIPVEELTENTIFVPVIAKNLPPDSIRIFPAKVELQFVVGLSDYESITADSFLIEADFKNVNLNSDNNNVPVNLLRQPATIRAATFSPKSIEYFIVE